MNDKKILLSYGDGGQKTTDLINNLFLKHLKNDILLKLEDSAVVNCPSNKIAFTTDSFVVNPLFFPGGDIGKLSICGTINDLVTSGCQPVALSLALIIEEGFKYKDLEKIIVSIKNTLQLTSCKIGIVTGDTKVVEKGNADGLFINTSGIGYIINDLNISPFNIKEGDDIIINGTIAEHGIAILSTRKEFNFKTNIISDCAPLDKLVFDMLSVSKNIHALKDATRGGLARVLIELSAASNLEFEIFEEDIPIQREVKGICQFLGLDPLYVANEGKIVAFVSQQESQKVLEVMRKNELGKNAKIIGKVRNCKDTPKNAHKNTPKVYVITKLGTKRILNLHYSEQLPRIC